MNKSFIVYHASTGVIVRSGHCAPEDIHLQAIFPDEVVMEETARDDTHYVDTSTGMIRVLRTLVVEVEGTTISGLPPGSVVITEGQIFYVDDGVVELEYDFANTYDVKIFAPTYQPLTVTVTQL